MKFPRNARIFRGQLEAAPFASVFFLLLIFLLVASLLYTPGVHIKLPVADGLSGTDKPTVTVAIDANGRLYFESQLIIDENDLRGRLRKAAKNSPEPLALIVKADEAVTLQMLTRLTLIARDAGISEAIMATVPRAVGLPGQSPLP